MPGSSEASSTTAPAPSPNSTQVSRSLQSIIRVSVSAPMTSTRFAWPARTKLLATPSAYTKPEHAALTSNAMQPLAPRRSWIRHAVAGKMRSGVVVPSTTMSSSNALTPASANACWAARNARSPVVSPSAATRRSRMPVRVRIHSSLVSTIFSRSALVTTRSGSALPVARMRAQVNVQFPSLARKKTRRRSQGAARGFAASWPTRSILVDDGLLVLDHLAAAVVAVLGDVVATMDLARRRVGGELDLVQCVVREAHAATRGGFATLCNGHDGSPDEYFYCFCFNGVSRGLPAACAGPRTDASLLPRVPRPAAPAQAYSSRPAGSRCRA